jgi:hypothetical protein
VLCNALDNPGNRRVGITGGVNRIDREGIVFVILIRPVKVYREPTLPGLDDCASVVGTGMF